jgi:hypothetical protein
MLCVRDFCASVLIFLIISNPYTPIASRRTLKRQDTLYKILALLATGVTLPDSPKLVKTRLRCLDRKREIRLCKTTT